LTNSSKNILFDHLFRHQYGKMVAILSKIFGPSNLELIEDAIQDTFLQASLKWRTGIPDNPEAWLTQAAKNRTIDLFRQINAQNERHGKILHGSATLEINDFFLEHEVVDSQLRMIFLACHPVFSREEQIAFALKCISGFSLKEIAAALLKKEETIKKRIARSRKKIREQNLQLTFPSPSEIQSRFPGVLQVIYLIFNEGFHSTKKDALVDKELCGEALRLCKLLLTKEKFRTGSLYALFALLCFHGARIDSKIFEGRVIDLQEQDRTKWYQPMINMGHAAFARALEYDASSIYLLEAAIAREHLMSESFKETNWTTILSLYEEMYERIPSDTILLSMISVLIHMDELNQAEKVLQKVDPQALNRRKYLYHGSYAKIFEQKGEYQKALSELDKAIASCSNQLEKNYLTKKKERLSANV
jgi:RNA polymerase sigma factor (sigma-70 family)